MCSQFDSLPQFISVHIERNSRHHAGTMLAFISTHRRFCTKFLLLILITKLDQYTTWCGLMLVPCWHLSALTEDFIQNFFFFFFWSLSWANKWPVPSSRSYPSSSLCNGHPGLRLPIGRWLRSCLKYQMSSNNSCLYCANFLSTGLTE